MPKSLFLQLQTFQGSLLHIEGRIHVDTHTTAAECCRQEMWLVVLLLHSSDSHLSPLSVFTEHAKRAAEEALGTVALQGSFSRLL